MDSQQRHHIIFDSGLSKRVSPVFKVTSLDMGLGFDRRYLIPKIRITLASSELGHPRREPIMIPTVMTIRSIVDVALRSQKLVSWQEEHIQTLLLCRRFSEEDMVALARLSEAIIEGKVSKSSLV